MLPKALQDARQVKSDRGRVRYGHYEKEDGTRVPRFHDSEVGALAYAIQKLLFRRGLVDLEGNEVPVTHLVRRSSHREVVSGETEAEDSARQVVGQVMHGSKCNECGAMATIKKDGCQFCTACGHIGVCG